MSVLASSILNHPNETRLAVSEPNSVGLKKHYFCSSKTVKKSSSVKYYQFILAINLWSNYPTYNNCGNNTRDSYCTRILTPNADHSSMRRQETDLQGNLPTTVKAVGPKSIFFLSGSTVNFSRFSREWYSSSLSFSSG